MNADGRNDDVMHAGCTKHGQAAPMARTSIALFFLGIAAFTNTLLAQRSVFPAHRKANKRC